SEVGVDTAYPRCYLMLSLQHNQNANNNKKDYKGKYKALKAELAFLTKKIDNKSEESVSFEDEGGTRVKAFINIAEDEPVVGKTDARSSQWVEITMKKITKLNLDNESLRDEVSDLKKVIKKWTSSNVTLDQLLTEQVPGDIICALG
ncbi:hypothetical protein Tco_1296654, partial [Tanacetum coccineum]